MEESPTESAEHEARAAAPSRARRWLVRTAITLVVVALVMFAPAPIMRIIHANDARHLVDTLADGRADLLAKQNEFRASLAELGTPVRAWSDVACWLSPRYSDGDGEQDIVMFYWQQCALEAYEIYALRPHTGGAAAIAARLGGHTAGDPTCSEVLFDVLTPDYGASGSDEYAAALWWVDPQGEPPADQPERCTAPAPGDPDTARVSTTIDDGVSADAYVVYHVRSPIASVSVGCAQSPLWLVSCAGEPEGFPEF